MMEAASTLAEFFLLLTKKDEAMDALKMKEQDFAELQKKFARILKEHCEVDKARVRAELIVGALQDQVRALLSVNNGAPVLDGEEVGVSVMGAKKEEEERPHAAADKNTELLESNAVLVRAVRLRREELQEVKGKYERLLATDEQRQEAEQDKKRGAVIRNFKRETAGEAEELRMTTARMDKTQRQVVSLQDALSAEEDAKRRMMLRYIHATKEFASLYTGSGGNGSSKSGGAPQLQLAHSCIGDEEVHAIAALLRNNTAIEVLNLRGNNITDDGARALGAVLAGRSGLRHIDLRGNKIGKVTIRVLAEALERSERVRYVHVQDGGKIEALGDSADSTNTALPKSNSAVVTVCVVDVRDNHPEPQDA